MVDIEKIKHAIYIDLAKLAKKAGYRDDCSYYYDTQSKVILKGDTPENWNSTERYISVPDLLELVQWLSDQGIYVYARHYIDENDGKTYFMSEVFGKYYTNTREQFATYTSALNFGVEKALKENFD